MQCPICIVFARNTNISSSVASGRARVRRQFYQGGRGSVH